MYRNRAEAAYLLAAALAEYRHGEGVVLAVPRGGVPLGYIVARELGLPLDIVLSKKIGYPGQPEYAIGAVSLEGQFIRDRSGVSDEYIREETERIREVLRERQRLYYGDRTPQDLTGKIVIIVDDGIATGSTIISTAELVSHHGARRIVVAVPVASPRTIRKLEDLPFIDEVICLETPANFYAVGQFYEQFEQVTDEEVIRMLADANGGAKQQENQRPEPAVK